MLDRVKLLVDRLVDPALNLFLDLLEVIECDRCVVVVNQDWDLAFLRSKPVLVKVVQGFEVFQRERGVLLSLPADAALLRHNGRGANVYDSLDIIVDPFDEVLSNFLVQVEFWLRQDSFEILLLRKDLEGRVDRPLEEFVALCVAVLLILVGGGVDGQLLEREGPLARVVVEELEVVVPLVIGPELHGLVYDLGIDREALQLLEEGRFPGADVSLHQEVAVAGIVNHLQHVARCSV